MTDSYTSVYVDGFDVNCPVKIAQGEMTYKIEGYEDPSMNNTCAYAQVPNHYTGITLGHGYDIKSREKEEVKPVLLEAGLESDIAEAFANGAGLTGQAAEEYILNTTIIIEGETRIIQEYEMSSLIQRQLFNIVFPEYYLQTKDILQNAGIDFKNFTPKVENMLYELLTDITYQNGSIKPDVLNAFRTYANNKETDCIYNILEKTNPDHNQRMKERLALFQKIEKENLIK
jgi:hypothetical protein